MHIVTRITVLTLIFVVGYWFLTEIGTMSAGVATVASLIVTLLSWYLHGRKVL